VMLACDAPLGDAPSGVFIVFDGTAALVMVLERMEKTDDTPLVVGIVIGGMYASACDVPLGVGIVIGGTAAACKNQVHTCCG
jgi:hypothetical protein